MTGDITRYVYSTITGGAPNTGLKPKTTISGLETGWATVSDGLTKRLDAMIRAKTFPVNPGGGPPITNFMSTTWNFFFRNDGIASIFPI